MCFTHTYTNAHQLFEVKKPIGFDDVNSSMWKQGNTFLQNSRSLRKLMFQTYLTFYIKSFIHIWDNQKNPINKTVLSGEL